MNSFFLINDGNANFTFNTDRLDNYFFTKGDYYTAELIDIDKDGFVDLILAGHEHEGAVTTILWGNSYGKYFKELSTNLPSVDNFTIVIDIDAEDIDNDGDRDIILSRVSSGETGSPYTFYQRFYVQIIENQNNISFIDKTAERISDNEGDQWRSWVHLQDLDNDNDIDIYYQDDHHGNKKWLNNGQGIFTKEN